MTEALEQANQELEQELERVKNRANTSDRLNQYAEQDDIMLIYVQKIMTILYIVIYLFMVYSLYVDPNTSKLYFGFCVVIFALIPLVFWLIGKYFTDILLKTVKLFIKGNANYLYAQ